MIEIDKYTTEGQADIRLKRKKNISRYKQKIKLQEDSREVLILVRMEIIMQQWIRH